MIRSYVNEKNTVKQDKGHLISTLRILNLNDVDELSVLKIFANIYTTDTRTNPK